jgi:hypothetical protein
VQADIIYREANPILYSQNVFATDSPGEVFRFFTRIGLVNLKLIKKLSKAQLSPWVGLFYLLAEEASGLRCMRVYWSANETARELCDGFGAPAYSKEQPWNGVRGLGDNLFFVHASGKIQALEELVIEGFLEERMCGCKLDVICRLEVSGQILSHYRNNAMLSI